MYVAQIRLQNWQPFRDEHVLDLGPKAYAIVAKKKDDPDRSNGNGKSSLIEAIQFALYGEHRHRAEDGWITRGEAKGSVELVFSDGSRIRRIGSKGKRARVSYMEPQQSDAQAAQQAEAQRMIDKAIGLSLSDFQATCYFEQKRMSRLIVAKPEERMGIIAGWLNLERLQSAEDICRFKLSEVTAAIAANEAALQQLALQEERLDAQVQNESLLDKAWDTEVARLQVKLKEISAAKEASDRRMRLLEDARQYEKVVERGRKLREQRGALQVPSEDELKQAHEVVIAATLCDRERLKDVKSLEKVAQGNFDGKCPVAGIECPATKQINADRAGGKLRHFDAITLRTKSYEELQEAERIEDVLQGRVAMAQEIDRQILELIGRAKELKRAVAEVKLADEMEIANVAAHIDEEIGLLENELQVARTKRALCEAHHRSKSQLEESKAQYLQLRDELNSKLVTHREALLILGRNGAQRRVAEESLQAIEQGANAELQASGIDLSVSVLWSREGSSLASACDTCGNAFPNSTKVKQCTRCGAERGPKMINKLDIELSQRSGGFEDLAGIHLQLSASAWLRAARACAWETALLDEPWSAIDRAHRKMLARSIGPMLSGFGFAQSFVVTHSEEGRDLSGRIEIERDGDLSKVKVVD